MPGSHCEPLHTQLQAMETSSQGGGDMLPSHVCASEPGDVVMFDMRCWFVPIAHWDAALLLFC